MHLRVLLFLLCSARELNYGFGATLYGFCFRLNGRAFVVFSGISPSVDWFTIVSMSIYMAMCVMMTFKEAFSTGFYSTLIVYFPKTYPSYPVYGFWHILFYSSHYLVDLFCTNRGSV